MSDGHDEVRTAHLPLPAGYVPNDDPKTPPPLAAAEAQTAAAAAVRELASALTLHEADPDVLAEVAAAARRMAEQVRGAPRRAWMQRMNHLDRDEDRAADDIRPFLERAVGGPANPSAVPVLVRRDGDEGVVAEIVLDPMFQGAEGRAHGGIVAGLFDDVTGHLLTVLKASGVTGRLTVHYRAPTPTGETLTARAWLTKREGRRLLISAEIRDGDTVCATAEALYVVVDRGRFLNRI